MFKKLLLILLLISTPVFADFPVPVNTGVCLNSEEAQLVQLVNEYRVQNGLQALPASKWLSSTGQWKVWDRMANNAVGGACNTHSWSNARPDLWQAMCYTPDHAQAAQMWAKPRQISGGIYTGNGFENAADFGGTMTAAQALSQWQGSPSHNAVILQQGQWAGVPFGGLGVGILGGFAVLWFGDRVDPSGTMIQCPTDNIFYSGFEE
jgi:hypothetical protein